MNTHLIQEFVKREMQGICAAHDFFHIERVHTIALKLYEKESIGDRDVIIASTFLHESLDDKFFQEKGLEKKKSEIKSLLTDAGLDEKQIDGTMYVIHNIGYGKSLERDEQFHISEELKIVKDADRLESVGAIAIARTFAYGGRKGREIHNPEQIIDTPEDKESYRDSNSTSLNHFYEKLLLLKELMHTESAKKIAESRHRFMENYLEQFFKERNCEDV